MDTTTLKRLTISFTTCFQQALKQVGIIGNTESIYSFQTSASMTLNEISKLETKQHFKGIICLPVGKFNQEEWKGALLMECLRVCSETAILDFLQLQGYQRSFSYLPQSVTAGYVSGITAGAFVAVGLLATIPLGVAAAVPLGIAVGTASAGAVGAVGAVGALLHGQTIAQTGSVITTTDLHNQILARPSKNTKVRSPKIAGTSMSKTTHTRSENRRIGTQSTRGNVTNHIPFIDPVTTIECDHTGKEQTLKEHGITVKIPEGAIPKGKVIQVEMSVTLYGPFKFPSNTRPISPILWMCPQEDIEFKKPIEVTLPHIFTGVDQKELVKMGVTFAKAGHNTLSESKESHDAVFVFRECPNRPQFREIKEQGYGILETNHCCFICITSKQSPEAARKAGYLFSRIDETSGQDFKINYCVSFFLPSCVKALQQLFPDHVAKYHSHFRIEGVGAHDHEPCLKINIESVVMNKYLAAVHPKHGKITMSEVDFWSKGYGFDDMKLRHEIGLYPPRVIVNFRLRDPHDDYNCIIPVEVTGCVHKGQLDGDIILPLASGASSQKSPASKSIQFQLRCSKVLTETNHFAICKYLWTLEKNDIIRLGQDLGLLRSNLKKMSTLPDDMIDAWLNREDDVLDTSGDPTWKSLCKALKEIGQNGIANKIEIETDHL